MLHCLLVLLLPLLLLRLPSPPLLALLHPLLVWLLLRLPRLPRLPWPLALLLLQLLLALLLPHSPLLLRAVGRSRSLLVVQVRQRAGRAARTAPAACSCQLSGCLPGGCCRSAGLAGE